MRELDSIAIVGAGRLGTALAAALRATGAAVDGPLGRGADPRAEIVLLCVPDREIAAAAAAVTPGPLVGHCSGMTGLAPLAGHEAFGAAPADDRPRRRAAGRVRRRGLRRRGLEPSARWRPPRRWPRGSGCGPPAIDDEDRAAYHAAASIASNFLVTLEGAAERLAATAGRGPRAALAPLVRAAVEDWAALGAERALTGPIVRGDEETVARQRAAVEERTPDLLPAVRRARRR